MSKRYFFIITLLLYTTCIAATDNVKALDLHAFKLSIPKQWEYKKEQGEDSFVGKIVCSGVSIHFDFSSNGYANSLIPTEQEFLRKKEWQHDCYFCKPGITYTSDFNVKNEKAAEMKKLSTTDSTLVNVEADPSYKTKTNVHLPTQNQKIKFPKADYIADMTFEDSTVYIPIILPPEIKQHHIQVDTTDKYIIKTIWPKTPSKGMTAVYFRSRSAHLGFNMVGYNLSEQNQLLALKAFKSIIIK